MINIIEKQNCVGCGACVQACPKQCISFNEDEQGFRYPKVDVEFCIHCNLCDKVCPIINQLEPRNPLYTYAAKNSNPDIQNTSSSGGVFFALVEYVIKEKKGVVFGARFNNKWEVVHDFAETSEDAKRFKGSKYVQSYIGDNYKKAKEFLESGRIVLFSGTPCQISGLKLFLRKDYADKLICVDLVCHGVPSPLVWRDYLNYITGPKKGAVGKNTDFQSTLNIKKPLIKDISFRDKRISWEKFGFSVHTVARQGDKNSDSQATNGKIEEQELLFENHDKNLYMQGFLKDLYLRPSCYSCPTKCGRSHSDVTLADFWGITITYPELFKKQMFSLVLANSQLGFHLLGIDSIEKKNVNFLIAKRYNKAIERSASMPDQYSEFWRAYFEHGLLALGEIVRQMKPNMLITIIRRVKNKCKQIVKKYSK